MTFSVKPLIHPFDFAQGRQASAFARKLRRDTRNDNMLSVIPSLSRDLLFR